jgi:hypothetical protein
MRCGYWKLSSASGLASRLSIDAIACTLHLADVYERIAFPPEVLEAYPEEPSSA